MKQNRQSNTENMSQSTDRTMRVIECLASSRLPNRLVDIAQKLEMNQPTVLRYLKALCAQGYVYHDQRTGCYALTWRICRLSDSVKANLVLRSMARPFLDSLACDLHVSTCLIVEQENDTLYLDLVDNPRTMMRTALRIGKNAPMHTTGSGKLFLSFFSERRLNAYIEQNGLVRLTKNTITHREDLLEELSLTRERGYGLDNEECEEGHKCVSVPLYDYTGGIAAAFSAFDDVERMPGDRIEKELLPAMREAAREISFRMGSTNA